MGDKYSAFGTTLKVGIRQVETATIVGTITGNGNATVITTASGMSGNPITTSVAVLSGDTADTVAQKIRTALALVANIVAKFAIGGSGSQVVLTKLLPAVNDGTLNISIENNTCTGLTDDTSSDATVAGAIYTTIGGVQSLNGATLAMDTEDVTTHDNADAWEEHIPTILRSGEVTMDIVYDPATHGTLVGYKEDKTLVYAEIGFPGATAWSFPAYIIGFEPDAPHDGALTASVTMKISGKPILL